MDGCLGKSSVCALSPLCPWLVLGEEMEVVRSHPHRERRVERVVFGGTLWSQNSLLLHNEQDLSIAIPYRPQQVHSPFSIAKGVQTQASPFHLSRGVLRAITLVFWVDHLFQPFFIVWCMDCLFCRSPWSKTSRSVTGTGTHPDAFHCHRVPDSFQLPPCDGFVEVHHRGPLDLVRAPLVFVRYRASFLGGQVLGDFPGLCKILHETTLLVTRMEPHGILVVPTCLFLMKNHMGFLSCLPVFSLLL